MGCKLIRTMSLHIENRLKDVGVGEKGEDGRQGESNMETQPSPYVKKQRCYFASKGPSCQGCFPVVMCGCESWTIKKAEHQRIDAFELWCWRRLLRVPWIARRSNQSILKGISPGCSLESLILKLKIQYFGHLM